MRQHNNRDLPMPPRFQASNSRVAIKSDVSEKEITTGDAGQHTLSIYKYLPTESQRTNKSMAAYRINFSKSAILFYPINHPPENTIENIT